MKRNTYMSAGEQTNLASRTTTKLVKGVLKYLVCLLITMRITETRVVAKSASLRNKSSLNKLKGGGGGLVTVGASGASFVGSVDAMRVS